MPSPFAAVLRPTVVVLPVLLAAGGVGMRPLVAQDTTRVAAGAVRTPPPVPPPWGLGLEIGYTDISGNRDLQVFQGAFTAEHRQTIAYVFNNRIEVRYGRSNNVVAVSNGALRLRFDWRPRSSTSPFLGLDVESDQFRKIDSRVALGTGINFNIAPREDRRTTIAIGMIVEVENRFAHVVPRHVSDTRFHSRFSTLQPIGATSGIEVNARYQPSTSGLRDYLLSTDVSARMTLSRTLAFRTRYEWKRDSTPAPGVSSRDDRSLTVSLLVTF